MRLKPPSSAALALGIYRPPLHGGWSGAQSTSLEPRGVPFLGICAQELGASPRPHPTLAPGKAQTSRPLHRNQQQRRRKKETCFRRILEPPLELSQGKSCFRLPPCCFTGLELAYAFRLVPQPAGLFLPLLEAPLPNDFYILSQEWHTQTQKLATHLSKSGKQSAHLGQ